MAITCKDHLLQCCLESAAHRGPILFVQWSSGDAAPAAPPSEFAPRRNVCLPNPQFGARLFPDRHRSANSAGGPRPVRGMGGG